MWFCNRGRNVRAPRPCRLQGGLQRYSAPQRIHFGGHANLSDSGRRQEETALASTKADCPFLPKYTHLLLVAQKQLTEQPLTQRLGEMGALMIRSLDSLLAASRHFCVSCSHYPVKNNPCGAKVKSVISLRFDFHLRLLGIWGLGSRGNAALKCEV